MLRLYEVDEEQLEISKQWVTIDGEELGEGEQIKMFEFYVGEGCSLLYVYKICRKLKLLISMRDDCELRIL